MPGVLRVGEDVAHVEVGPQADRSRRGVGRGRQVGRQVEVEAVCGKAGGITLEGDDANSALDQFQKYRLVLGHSAGQAGLVDTHHHVETTMTIVCLLDQLDARRDHCGLDSPVLAENVVRAGQARW